VSLAIFVGLASFSWTTPKGHHHEKNSMVSLLTINLEVKKGALVAIVGLVSFGKNSLLACIFRGMPKL
jgi:ABC-type phosphate/phosphonate transport system ATPase subunit